MGVRQVFAFHDANSALVSTSPQYTTVTQQFVWQAVEANAAPPWLVSGRFSRLRIRVNAPLASGKSVTWTLRVAGADTPVTLTLGPGQTEATTDVDEVVDILANELLALKMVMSASDALSGKQLWHTLEFDGASVGQSGYGWSANTLPTAGTSECAIFNSWTAWVSGALNRSVVALAGMLNAYDVRINAAPGAGKSWEFAVYKNGTKQDGAGGTVDTRVTISDSATSGTAAFALALVAGDYVSLRCTPSGTPTSAVDSAIGFRFTATTDGESQFGGHHIDRLTTNGSTEYVEPTTAGLPDWSALEPLDEAELIGAHSTFTLRAMRVLLNGTATITFTTRRNLSSPAGTPTVALVAAASGVDAVGTIEIASGDTLSLQYVQTAGSNRVAGWAWVQYALSSLQCFGGGAIAVVADPAAGEVFTGRTLAPRAWLTLGFDDAARSFALDQQNDPPSYHGGPKLGSLVNIGTITRQLSSRFSSYQMGSCAIQVDDAARLLSTLEADPDAAHWFNREGRIFLASRATKVAAGTAHTLFRGIWTGHRSRGLTRTIELTDILGSEFSDFNLEQTIPKRLITVEDFPDCPEETLGRVVPIAYGTLSDTNEQVYVVPPVGGSAPTGLAKPANFTGVVVGSAGSATHKYGVTAQSQAPTSKLDHSHETDAATVTVTNAPKVSEMGASRYIEFDWDTVPGAYNYRIYGRDEGQPATGLNLLDSARGPAHPGGAEERYNDGERNGHDEVDIEKKDSHPPATNNTIVAGDPGTPGSEITTDTGRGKIRPTYVGLRTLADSSVRHEFLIAGHAITHIEGYYQSDVRIAATDAELPLGPEQTAWTTAIGADPWVTYNGHRYATLYMQQGGRGDTAADGTEPLTINICAIEDVGDATGRTITRAPRVAYHLIDHWVLQSYEAGTWPAAAASEDGIPWLNSTSFDALEAIEVDRIGGEGYEAAIYLDAPLTVRQLLERILMSLDMRFGQNEHGQIIATHLDEFADLASAVALTDVHDLVEDTDIDRALGELENHIDFDYDYRPADQTFEVPNQFVEDTLAITANRARPAIGEHRALYYAGTDATALDVVGRALSHGKYPPRYVTVVCTLHAVRVHLGDIVLVTDVDGVGAAGWMDRPLWVLGIETLIGSLDDPAPTVTLHCVDVHRLLGESAVLGDSTTLVSWTSASDADKRTYMFLGDTATGKFSDGAPMKRLR